MEEPIISKYKEGEIAKQGDSQEKKVLERAPVSHEEKVVHPNKMLYHGPHDRNDDPKNKEQTVLKETGESERSKPEVSIIEEPLKYSPDSKAGLLEYPERRQGAARENYQGRQDKEETPLGAQEKVVYLGKMQHRQRQDQHDDSLKKNQLLLQESEGKEELNREGYEFEGSKLDKGLECSCDYKEKSIEHPVRQQGEKQIEEQQDDAANAKYLVEQAVIEKAKSSETITELGAAVRVNNPGITSSDELGKFTGNQTDKRESILPKYKQGDDSQGKQMQEKASESREEKVVYPNKIKYHANVEKSALKEAGENKHPKSEVANIEESLKSSPDYEDDYQEKNQVKRIQDTAVVDHKEQVVHPHEIENHNRQNDSTNENPSALQETGEKEERKGDSSERKEHFTCSHNFQESSFEQPEREQVRDRTKLREGSTVNGEILLEQTVSDTTESLETIMEEDTSVSLNNQGKTISDNDDDSKEDVREKAFVGHEEKVVEEIQDKDRQDKCDVLTKKDLSPLLDTDENKEPKLKASKIEAPLKSSPDHNESLLECIERPQEDVATEDHYQVKQEKEKGPLSHEQKNGHLNEMQYRDLHDLKDDPTVKEPSVLDETGQSIQPKSKVPMIEEPLKSSPDQEESSLEYSEGQQEEIATKGDSQPKQVKEKEPLSDEQKIVHLDEMQDRERHDQKDDLTNNEPSVFEETGQNEDPKPEVCKIEEPLKSNPDHEESSLECTEGQQEDVSTEGDSQEKQIKEKGPLSHEEKNENFDEMPDGDRHDQKDGTTIKEPSVLEQTNQNEDPKPQVSKIEEPLKSSPDHEESSFRFTEGQQEKVATEGDSEETQVNEKGPLSHEQTIVHFYEKYARDRHNQQDDPTNKESSMLDKAGHSDEPKPEMSKIEEHLKPSPDYEESSLEYTEGQQEEVATEGDSQEKQVEEKGPLRDEEKNGHLYEMQYRGRHDQQVDPTNKEPSLLEETGQNEEPRPEVSKIEEPRESNPDHEKSSLEYTEGQQEDVSTEGDSQEKQIEEKGPLSHEEKNGNLDEMQDRDRHDHQVDPTIKDPSVFEEAVKDEEPKPEVPKIAEPLKSSPDHEESLFEYTEGQQEEVATEGDSQETQVNEKGPLSHGEKNGHLDEMQDSDRHDQKDDTTIKEPSVLEQTNQNEDPKPQVSKIEEPLKSSPDHEESSFRFTEGQQEKVATEGDSQEKQVNEKGPLGQEQTIVHFYEKQDRDRHNQQDDPTNKEPSVLDKIGQSDQPKTEMSKAKKPLKLSPDHDGSSLGCTERKQEEVASEGHYQVKQVKEKGPLTHEKKNGHIDEIQYRDRHDLKDDSTIKEPSVLDKTGQNKEPKPEVPMIEEPLKSSPDQEDSSLEYSEGQQEEVSATEDDSQEKQVEEKGPLSHEEKNGNFDEMQYLNRHDQQVDPTIKEPLVLKETGKNQEPKPKVPKIEEVLKSSSDHEESSLEYAEGQQEEVATEGDSQEKRVEEKRPLSHGEKNGNLDEMQYRDRHDHQVDPTIKEPSVLEETGKNEEPKPEVSKIEEPLKSSPDHEGSSLECTDWQKEEVATEGDSQEKQVEEKGPLSHDEKNENFDEIQGRDRDNLKDEPTIKELSFTVLEGTGQNEEPKPEVSKIKEPLKFSPDHEESSLKYTEGQQEEVATEGDSQETQVNEKGLLGHGVSEVSMVEEPLKSNPDHEESSLEYSEGQQEEVATEGDSQEKQVKEKGPLSHEQINGHLDEMQDRDRHDQKVVPTNKELSVLQETGQNEQPKPQVSEIEEPLKSSTNYDENSFEHPERQQGVVASQDDSRGKREQEKAPMSHEEKCINHEKIQHYDRHLQHDDRRNKNSELQETGENEELKREGSNLDDPVISNCDNEEMSLQHTERQQVKEKKELRQNEAVKVESLVEQPVSDQTESIQTIIEDDAVVTVKKQEITNSNELRIPNGKQTDKREPALLKNKKDVVTTEDDSQQVQGEAPVSHGENIVHIRTIQDYDGHAMHDDPSNNAQSKSVLPETGESKQTTLEEYKIEERLKLNPDYKESSLEYLERQREAATQNDFEDKKVEEKVPLTHEERSLHPSEMQDHDRHIKLDNSKNKDQSVLQETSENEKPKLHASKIEEPLKSFSNNEGRTLECLERQQKEVATQDDSPVKQVQEKALVGHKEQVMHPVKMQDLDRQDQQNDSTSKNQFVLQGKEERKREGLERKEPLESSYNFEERLLENLEREQVKNKKKMQEDNAVNGGSVVEQADCDKTESLETINEEHAFVSLNNVVNAISDDDDFQEQQERDISFVGHEEKFLEELLNKDLIQQHQYGDVTNKDLTVLQETSESQEPKLKECSLEYSEKQQEEFDSQDKQVKEKGPSMHEQKIVHLDEMQDPGQPDQQDDPTQKEPSVLQEIGENEESKLEDSELEEHTIEEALRYSSDYEERSLENPDSNQVHQQKELQKDDVVRENVVEQEVIDKTESMETMTEDISFSASSRVTADSDEFGKPSSKQANMTDQILSKCKENEVPLQADCQDGPVQKEDPVRQQANVVYPEKVEVHDGVYLQDDPANNNHPVVQITNENLKLKEPIKPSSDYEEWSQQREAPVNKKRKSAISLLWCWCCG